MADKKITALTAATEAATEDLLHIIDDPSGSPVNKKLSVKNFLSNITHVTTGTVEATAEIVHKTTHTVNTSASSTGTYDMAKASAITIHPVATGASQGNVDVMMVGSESTAMIDDANVAIKGVAAGMRAVIDMNALDNTDTTGTHYAICIEHANSSATPTVNATAFIKIGAPAGGSANADYGLDIVPGGGYGAAAGANAGPFFTSGANTADANGAIKCRVSGDTKYILLYDNIG